MMALHMDPHPIALALPVLLVGLACEPRAEIPDHPAGAARSEAPAARPAVEPTTKLMPVAWPPHSAIDLSARAALDDQARQAVDQAPVPVMVPAGREWLARARVIARQHWVAVSSANDGVTISIQGNRLAHRYPQIPPARGNRQIRGWPGFITQQDHIWSLSWLEHGVAYTLDLECASPEDARCADERHALELAAGLAYVGGDDRTSTAGATP